MRILTKSIFEMMHSIIILNLFIFVIFNSCNVYCITMKIDTNKIYSKTWSNRQGLVLTPITTGKYHLMHYILI